jgi:hypothetical protein
MPLSKKKCPKFRNNKINTLPLQPEKNKKTAAKKVEQ